MLEIGEEGHINLIAGNRGSRDDTICAVSENFLVPGKDRIIVTLIAASTQGKEIREVTEIKGHC